MSTLGNILAPKPIRRPLNVVNNVNNNANNNPKKSSVHIYRYSTKISRVDIKSSSHLTYLNTSSTLRDSDALFLNIESDLEQESFGNEICSILTQQDEKLPFALCEDEDNREEPQDVERVKNPFEKNFELDNENNEYFHDICPFSSERLNIKNVNEEEEKSDDLL